MHGSFYQHIDPEMLYEGVESYVAPEIFEGQPVTATADVYSLGCFIDWLYRSSGLPMELKPIVKKAMALDPAQRYPSVEALRQAVNKARTMRHAVLYGGSALAIALCIVGLFFYMLPSTEPIEFVKPVKEPIPEDMLEDNLDEYLGIGADMDSATIADIVEQNKLRDTISADDRVMKQYNAKAEAIFRKQFTKAAEAIISKVYNVESMNGEQTVFAAKTRQMTEDLAKKQEELAGLTDLSSDRTQAIASEIIENITRKKMEAMDKDYIGLKPRKEEKNTFDQDNSSSSTDVTSPTTTTTTSSSSSSSSSSSKQKSNESLYDRNRDKYGIDPFDPVNPDNHKIKR